MSIKEIHGFEACGKVYPTRPEAEHAVRVQNARARVERYVREMASPLAAMLHSNFVENNDRHRTAEGVCEDLLPIYRDTRTSDAEKFLGVLTLGIEALEDLRKVEASPRPSASKIR